MMKRSISLLAAGAVGFMATVAFAANPMVGGAAMMENKNIVENAMNSKDHTTLVAAVKAAGLEAKPDAEALEDLERTDARRRNDFSGKLCASSARAAGQDNSPDITLPIFTL